MRNSMSASTSAVLPTSVYTTPAFWERLWRTAGVQALALFVVAYFIYGTQPQVGASADTIVAFYDGNRTRILIAAALCGVAMLNLLWFAAATELWQFVAARALLGASVGMIIPAARRAIVLNSVSFLAAAERAGNKAVMSTAGTTNGTLMSR